VPRKLGLLAALLALILFAAACSGDPDGGGETSGATTAPTTDEQLSEEPSDGESSEPSMVISSGSETVSIGGGELPEGWPDTFPLPEGAELAGSASSPGNYVVWFSSGGSTQEDLKAFFDDELPANGWTIESELDFGDDAGSYSAYAISGNGYSGGVYVGEGAPGSEGFEGDFAFWVALTAE
jgi:hypothetical protein